MNIIFLDVDGVVNCVRSYDRWHDKPKPVVPEEQRRFYPHWFNNPCSSDPNRTTLAVSYYFDPECIAALNWLVKESEARVVISSTWRAHNLINLHAHFRWQGYEGPRFYSRTPDTGTKVVKRWNQRHGYEPRKSTGVILHGQQRGLEIDWWLQNVGKDRVESFVILDDDKDMAPHMDRLVQTDVMVGLTHDNAKTALEVLKRPWRDA